MYLYDTEAGGLVRRAFEDSPQAAAEHPWTPGEGVVGAAWETGAVQQAIGEAASDGSFNLGDARRERHASLSAVAAAPILNDAGRVIGVVSASERNALRGHELLADDAATEELIAISAIVSRYLVDLLGWFPDDI